VKVKPGSFKDEISIDENNQWIIKIREKPIDGAANEYLIKFLSKELKIRKSAVVIKKGLTSQFKTIELDVSEENFSTLFSRVKK
jgi:uncharacterized protein YggU (UPF0235/DUF167 family)